MLWQNKYDHSSIIFLAANASSPVRADDADSWSHAATAGIRDVKVSKAPVFALPRNEAERIQKAQRGEKTVAVLEQMAPRAKLLSRQGMRRRRNQVAARQKQLERRLEIERKKLELALAKRPEHT